MGKSQQKQAETLVNDNNKRTVAQGDQTRTHLQDNLPGAEQTAKGTYSAAEDAYKSYSGGMGSYDPGEYKAASDRNEQDYKTGGYNDPTQLATLNSHIQRNAETGGYTPEELSQLQAGGLGGINAEQAGNIRGGYNSLINTGGISEDTAGAMRRQAAGTTQSIYATMGKNLTRQQGIAGVGGAGGEAAQMARQASQQGAVATTNANAEIGKLRQTGTIAGLGGLSEFENKAAAGQRDVDRSAQQGRLQGTEQESHLASDQAHNRLDASHAQQDMATGAAQQRIQAAGGLVNLYNSSPGYVTSLVQQILQQQQQTGQLTNDQSQVMTQLGAQPGLFDRIMGTVTQLAGAAGGVMTGIGAMGGGGRGGAGGKR